MKMESANIREQNIDKIAEIFPNVITEAKDEDGNIKKVINFDLLKNELEVNPVDERDRYEFNWVGKRQSIAQTYEPIIKTLRPVKSKSKNWEGTENLFIEGNNIDTLKILQESYLNTVQMIYIDPPYNSGEDFIYKDDYRMDTDDYNAQIGMFDEEENKLFKNTESNGRFHSDWCNSIYPSIKLSQNLLKDDGVIFISIDDNELYNLKKICDEIFGESNFIANIVRNTNSSKNQSLFVSVSHEYCLVYAKNIETLKLKHRDNKWAVPKNNVDEYIKRVKQLEKEGLSREEITAELKSLTKYPRFIDFTNYWYFDDRGLYRKDNMGGVRNGNLNPIYNPLTKKNDSVPPGGYRYQEETLKELLDADRIHFHTDGSLPTVKRYLHENMEQRPKSIMSDDQRPDYSMMKAFNTPFDNPKQLAFIKRILSLADKNAIIMDFFAGSSTTAHGIMELNKEDRGQRKYIMIQLDEEVNPKSKAYKQGYKTITDISIERISKAGEAIVDDVTKNTNDNWVVPDIGFRYFKLDDSNMKDIYYSANEYSQDMIASLESNIKEDRSDLDLLYGVMIDWGLPLSLNHETEKIGNATTHIVDYGSLVACFEDSITDDVVKGIAQKRPLRAVFRDSSFNNSPDKINVTEIFKLYSPNTTVKVI